MGNAAGSPGVEEGRGKVAGTSSNYEDNEISPQITADNIFYFSALLKQQGVKGAAKNTAPVNEEVPPLLEGGGKLEVALINIPFL